MHGNHEHRFGERGFFIRVGQVPDLRAHFLLHVCLHHQLLHLLVSERIALVRVKVTHHLSVILLVTIFDEPDRVFLLRRQLFDRDWISLLLLLPGLRHEASATLARWPVGRALGCSCAIHAERSPDIGVGLLMARSGPSSWSSPIKVVKARQWGDHVTADGVFVGRHVILHVSDESERDVKLLAHQELV